MVTGQPRRARLLLALALCVLCAPAGAAAANRTVLLVDPSPGMLHAVGVALGPWGVAVSAVEGGVPPTASQLSALTDEGRRLAARHGAQAVAWFAAAEGPALLVFDVASGEVLARPLAQAPSDAANEAATALSLKTLLLRSGLAPPEERQAPPPPRERRTLKVELATGGNAVFGEPSALEFRAALALSVWPRRLRHHLGVAVGLDVGSGVVVDRPIFSGRLMSLGIEATLRGRVELRRRLALEPRLGLDLRVLFLDGVAPPFASEAHVRRVDPAVVVGLAGDVAVGGGVALGLVLTLDVLLLNQRFLVRGQPVAETYPLELGFALRLSVGAL